MRVLLETLRAALGDGPEVDANFSAVEDVLSGRFERFRYKEDRVALLFTGNRAEEVNQLLAKHPEQFAAIHTTPAGRQLNNLRLSERLDSETAALLWNIAAAGFIEINRPRKVMLFFDAGHNTSILFGNEIHKLLKVSPDCTVMQGDGSIITSQQLLGLRQWHVRDYVTSGGMKGKYIGEWIGCAKKACLPPDARAALSEWGRLSLRASLDI